MSDPQSAKVKGRRRARVVRLPCQKTLGRQAPKRAYTSHLEALEQAARNARRGRTDRFVHRCDGPDGCGWWHLTSQDPATIGLAWDAQRGVYHKSNAGGG